MSTAAPNPLRTHLAGITLESPLVLASGILGVTASTLAFAARAGAAAVTVKTCGLEPRKGHPGPAILPLRHGLLNAVGLSNPGVAAVVEELQEFRRRSAVPVFASIFGRTEEEFGEVAARMAEAQPDLLEVNVSCPNVASELGQPFGADEAAVARITARVKAAAGAIPVSIKLTIHCPSIERMARVCRDHGADVITAINTVGPGMHIDVPTARPVLSNREGGLSGAAILPLAVRAVYRIRAAVDLPVIGTGGVEDTDAALQLILAGAHAVGIGTGVWTRGAGIFQALRRGLEEHLAGRGLPDIAALRGLAHGT
ncbi:MAG: dihydroorotate dehydrogenase [Deltaproteobacteria bacterium]|nr:dihydroorotate dehydrogenase [Deltaproteobacteria bacterium]